MNPASPGGSAASSSTMTLRQLAPSSSPPATQIMAFIQTPLPPTRHHPFPTSSPPTLSPRRPRLLMSTPPSTFPHPTPETPQHYLQSLGISPEHTNRILSRHPNLATHPNLRHFAAPTISYLRTTLHLTPAQITRTLRNAPQILTHPLSSHPPRLHFLRHHARIPPHLLPAAVAKCPHLLWMNLKSAADVVDHIVHACPLITPTSLGSLFSKVPQALVTPPHKINTNILHIRNAGVTNPASMARIFAKAPLALVFDPDKTISARLNYFSNVLHLSPETVGKLLVSTPELLEWSLEKKLKPRVALLESLVGADALPAVLNKVPSILTVDDILDRVLWLKDDVGLNSDQIRTVVRQAPAILTYSVVGNLAPKWTFIHETIGATCHDLVAAPRELLCANLQQRAMPRYAFLASAGKTDVPPLHILRGSDVDFCRHVAHCDPDTFRAYVDDDTYLLFFSRLV